MFCKIKISRYFVTFIIYDRIPMIFKDHVSFHPSTLQPPRFGTLQPPKLYRFIHPKSTLQPPKFDTLHPQWEFFNSKKTSKNEK